MMPTNPCSFKFDGQKKISAHFPPKIYVIPKNQLIRVDAKVVHQP